MLGFIHLESATLSDQRRTGEAIIRLCKSVGDETPSSEWSVFKADPKAWLHAAGYRYTGPGAGPDGQIPAAMNIVPVYDTADTMHVRIPFKDLVDPAPADIQNEPTYGAPGANRFPVLLARYFMRRCR